MAAVDSSVIIHLARIGKLYLLHECFEKIRISRGIESELTAYGKAGTEDVQKGIGDWIMVEKIMPVEKSDMLSAADRELIKLAEIKKDFVLTNDENIISFAKAKGVETMWLTSFLILCLRKKIINKKEAAQILYDLVKHGCYIRTDTYAAVQAVIEEL